MSTTTLRRRRTTSDRINRLIARVRHRQLTTALRGKFAESFRYAKWAARVRRAMKHVTV